jgi:hypothetical protein
MKKRKLLESEFKDGLLVSGGFELDFDIIYMIKDNGYQYKTYCIVNNGKVKMRDNMEWRRIENRNWYESESTLKLNKKYLREEKLKKLGI